MRRTLISLVGFLLLTSCIHPVTTDRNELSVGDRLPRFSICLNDGSTVTESDFSEGDALIAFFNTGCPDCREGLEVLQEFHDAHSYEVRMVLVSREEKEQSVAAYWQAHGLSMPYSAQPDRKIYSLFSNSGIPKIYIMEDGVITSVLDDGDDVTAGTLELAFSGQTETMREN